MRPRHDPPFHPYATEKSLERWESLWEEPCTWTGTEYPSNASVLADLVDEDGPLRRPFPYTIPFQTATQYLQSLHIPNHALSPSQEAAAARLRTLHEFEFSGQWLGDILMKMFSDLDILLFESTLGGNVYLCYTTAQLTPALKYETAGTILPGDYTTESKRKNKRFCIVFNADKMLLNGRRRLRDLIALLVHEMTVSLPAPNEPAYLFTFNHKPPNSHAAKKLLTSFFPVLF